MSQNDILKLYTVQAKYIDELRNKEKGGDESVYYKDNRPHIGIIDNNGQKYVIPITKHKERAQYLTNTELDFMPIYRHGEMVACIELNKMIPVPDNQLRDYNLRESKHNAKKENSEDRRLAQYEQEWCKKHSSKIIEKAQNLYTKYISGELSPKEAKRCINFPTLEKICCEYEKAHPSIETQKNNKDHHNNDKNNHSQRKTMSSRAKKRQKREKQHKNKKFNKLIKATTDMIAKLKASTQNLSEHIEHAVLTMEENKKNIVQAAINMIEPSIKDTTR